MKIIKHRERIEQTRFFWCFEWKNSPGSGFSLDCDKDGNLLNNNHENYNEKCNNTELINKGIKSHSWTYTEPAVGECNCCGNEVILQGFTNTCECGRDYNSAGQQLAPREQWGEETNESLSDILRIR